MSDKALDIMKEKHDQRILDVTQHYSDAYLLRNTLALEAAHLQPPAPPPE